MEHETGERIKHRLVGGVGGSNHERACSSLPKRQAAAGPSAGGSGRTERSTRGVAGPTDGGYGRLVIDDGGQRAPFIALFRREDYPMTDSIIERLERVEAQFAIGQLAIRYALAVDARDVDAWLDLFVPDVQVGRDRFGRESLRDYIEPALQGFYRSMHQICGHRIEVVDRENARGTVYCRAEHEVRDRWIVLAVCYSDSYRCVGGEWLFVRRKERHWYSADVTERPQDVGFHGWPEGSKPPRLPAELEAWAGFWQRLGGAAEVSGTPC